MDFTQFSAHEFEFQIQVNFTKFKFEFELYDLLPWKDEDDDEVADGGEELQHGHHIPEQRLDKVERPKEGARVDNIAGGGEETTLIKIIIHEVLLTENTTFSNSFLNEQSSKRAIKSQIKLAKGVWKGSKLINPIFFNILWILVFWNRSLCNCGI